MEKIQHYQQKITPFLWFDNNAEEAITYYTSVFRNPRVKNITRNGAAGPRPRGNAPDSSV
ncbi:MAG: VOC family protein [Adhaeribacter sp.]